MVQINDLSQAINRELSLYSDSVREAVDKVEKSVSNLAVRRLKVEGSFQNNRSTRNYRSGWRAKRLSTGGYIVYNATSYQLTHLLEYGHALRGGGRARAFPHIRQVETEIQQEFERRIRSELR